MTTYRSRSEEIQTSLSELPKRREVAMNSVRAKESAADAEEKAACRWSLKSTSARLQSVEQDIRFPLSTKISMRGTSSKRDARRGDAGRTGRRRELKAVIV